MASITIQTIAAAASAVSNRSSGSTIDGAAPICIVANRKRTRDRTSEITMPVEATCPLSHVAPGAMPQSEFDGPMGEWAVALGLVVWSAHR